LDPLLPDFFGFWSLKGPSSSLEDFPRPAGRLSEAQVLVHQHRCPVLPLTPLEVVVCQLLLCIIMVT